MKAFHRRAWIYGILTLMSLVPTSSPEETQGNNGMTEETVRANAIVNISSVVNSFNKKDTCISSEGKLRHRH